jgi:DNA-binding transcriptional LysR family regulator
MDWDDIRVFLAVARAESLARGAKEAGLDRSTASRRITALEAALGAQVFLRTREGLRLSPAGERLRERAERMAAEARALAAEAGDTASQISGTVRIATTEALAVLLVEEGLLSLREQHPQLILELLGGNRPVDLARGEAELALRVTPVREANVQVRCVVKLGLALFAAESYVRRRGAPTSEAELAGHDVVLPSSELAMLPEAKWLASRPGVQVAFRSSSMPALLAATAAGAGIGAITDAWGLRVPALRRLFPLESVEPRPLWLATAPEAASRAAVRLVGEHIATIFGRSAAPVAQRVAAR